MLLEGEAEEAAARRRKRRVYFRRREQQKGQFRASKPSNPIQVCITLLFSPLVENTRFTYSINTFNICVVYIYSRTPAGGPYTL